MTETDTELTNNGDVVYLSSLTDVMDDFDGFLVDQFGVLHNGERPYPNAIKTLERLMQAGKTVIIISNSGKRSEINVRRMTTLGFKRGMYSELVTSGDVAYSRVEQEYLANGLQCCLLIARDNDTSAVDGLGLELVSNAENADFIIVSASEGDKYPEQHYADLLRHAALRRLPCLCTNPDKLMLTSSGIRFGAGRIAEIYESMGGVVHWIGKPYPQIYEYALRRLPDTNSERILCIGDSIEHDIAGGASVGLKTLFIRGGIHQEMSSEEISRYMEQHNAKPDFLMPLLA